MFTRYFSQKLRQSQGFTLLEILVVISIIGILIALGAAAFSNAQRKARDARRQGDMKSYQSVYEQYYANNSGYAACATMDAGFAGGSSGTPTDPKDGAYVSSCDASSYCVCAELDGGGGNSGANCTFGSATTHYCVTNLQ